MSGGFLSRRALALAPSSTLAMGARAKQLQAEGRSVISFSVGEPGFPTPSHICEAAKCAIDSGRHGYTPTGGTPDLREAVAKSLSQKIGAPYKASQTIVSPGGKYSIYLTLLALLNPGDEVIIPAPYWVSYPEMVRLADGIPVFVESREEDGFAVSPEAVEKAITPKTKLVILNSPTNPSGQVTPPAVIEALGRLMEKRELWCLSDEIYDCLVFGGAIHRSIASVSDYCLDRTVVVNGCSKTYSMTGWRIGWIGANAAMAKAVDSIQSQTCSAPAFASQAAALAALTGPQDSVAIMAARFDQRRVLLHRLLNAIPGVSMAMPSGAFYALPNVSRLFGREFGGRRANTSLEFCEIALEKAHVAMVSGEGFGAPDHIRISYAASEKDIEEGCGRLAGLVGGMD
ncbi:MAG: pyridoxal phosphate-dependent aminotransferase [Planctomycetota bacterium]|jgi:aspartate aminotransferase|nr:pyridoxal phosphate-dependent aminotransferase [Planctomycetota bacterium]